MPKLTCASCGAKAAVRPSDGAFEIRGRWPDGHRPVVKCNACGSGLIVNPRLGFLIFWPKATAIPDDTWRSMARYWREHVELRDPTGDDRRPQRARSRP